VWCPLFAAWLPFQIADFDLFTNANFFVIFLLFFLFGVSMMCLAFLLSTLISSAATAQTIGCVPATIARVVDCAFDKHAFPQM